MTDKPSDPDAGLAAAADTLRSADPMTRKKGVERLLAGGADATSVLIGLAGDADDAVRAEALYLLAELANPGAAPTLLAALEDAVPLCRAEAARGLHRISHPDALEAALRTLDDAPDMLHSDITPAVLTLAEIGLPAVPGVLDGMLSSDSITRLHAQRALEGVVQAQHGFVRGRGFPSAEDDAAVGRLWRANGNYRYDATESARNSAVAVWRTWYDEQAAGA